MVAAWTTAVVVLTFTHPPWASLGDALPPDTASTIAMILTICVMLRAFTVVLRGHKTSSALDSVVVLLMCFAGFLLVGFVGIAVRFRDVVLVYFA